MKQYKLSHIARAAMLLAVFAMLAACEKPILDDGSVDGGSPSDANVVLHFTQSEGSDFTADTRAAAREVINAALDTDVTSGGNYLYDDNGTVKQRNLSFTTGEGNTNFGATARVRPVVTVTIAKE